MIITILYKSVIIWIPLHGAKSILYLGVHDTAIICLNPSYPHTEYWSYPYTDQLLELEGCRRPIHPQLPREWRHIITPFHSDFWKKELASHHDKRFVTWVCDGIEQGFHIGVSNTGPELHPSRGNMLSAVEHPQVVTEYIQGELAAHHLLRVDPTLTNNLTIHTSPLGVIPKKGRPNCWRLIMDLSAPQGHSVNDRIDKERCSLHYSSLDDAATKVAALGPGALLAKMDICQAYRNVPVAPEDRLLLGMQWENQIYIDQVLPFGLRSAPMIFSAIADALLWIMLKRGVSWAIHYIDDFLTIGTAHTGECLQNTQIMHAVCEEAGVPIEQAKSVGPTTNIVFLGILIDTEKGELRLPQEKLTQLQAMLAQWRGRKACRKRELLSLIGSLSHACRVVRSGRTFLRRLIDLSTQAARLDHFIRLNAEARADLEWWYQFIVPWNGVSMLSTLTMQSPVASIYTDASGRWGCGAVCQTDWFQLEWDSKAGQHHISTKELIPIVIAAAIWGHQFRGKALHILSDNAAAVAAINNQTSSIKEMAHLLRCLAFIAARFQIRLFASHIPGRHNEIADALSRNNLCTFYALLPQASRVPSSVPDQLTQLPIPHLPDWTSQHWTVLWSTIFQLE